MPVALLPPVTSSGGPWSGQHPLHEAPRYVRGPNNSRWHRPRNATTWPDRRTIYGLWCGTSATDGGKYGPLWFTDQPPPDEPVCGTCEGRALGAKQDTLPVGLPELRFDPRWLQPPTRCPGSRSRTLWTPIGRCGQCLACGEIVPVRVIGVGYSAWGSGPVNHEPGDNLVPPCPFHSWQRLTARNNTAACDCGYPAGDPE